MYVVIGNQRVYLDKRAVIGNGGEAVVFRQGGKAIKIYHTPTREREAKLRDFFRQNFVLPATVIAPQDLVFDERGQKVLGFSMPLLQGGEEVLASLMKKNFRTAYHITTEDVIAIYLNAYQTLSAIHQAGLVVGDLNDLNELFKAQVVSFLDVDSFQFGQYPCQVATEAYLDPNLYGVDFSKRPSFKPENDWYSFAALLFRSLLLVHPFGGIHPSLKTLAKRAQSGISVLNPAVKYPVIAYNPDLLSDDLGEVFDRIFTKGWRGVFPLQELKVYAESLVECSTCGVWYPSQRDLCPGCQVRNLIVMRLRQVVKGVQSQELLYTRGEIVFSKVIGESIYCVTQEWDKVVLYIADLNQAPKRIELFPVQKGAGFDVFDHYLVVSKGVNSEELYLIDFAVSLPQVVLETTTELFGGTRPVFTASGLCLYRVAGGILLRGEIKYGQLIERPLTTTLENQTWFVVAPQGEVENELVFGFMRVFKDLHFFLINGQGRHDVAVAPLEEDERLVDIEVKFSISSLALLRRTRSKGVDYIRVEMVDDKGSVLVSQRMKLTEAEHYQNIHGQAYAAGVLLHPTAQGVLQEKLADRKQAAFTQTQNFVTADDTLYRYEKGVLVVKDDRVLYLTLAGT